MNIKEIISSEKASFFQALQITVYCLGLLISGGLSFIFINALVPFFVTLIVGIIHLWILSDFYDLVIENEVISFKNVFRKVHLQNEEKLLFVGRKDFIVVEFLFLNIQRDESTATLYLFLTGKHLIKKLFGSPVSVEELEKELRLSMK